MRSKPDKFEKADRPEPEDKQSMRPAQQSGECSQSGPPGALVEAYKKHVAELSGIEDRQSKIIAVLLGILSAAGTLLIKEAANLGRGPKVYVSLVTVAIVVIGHHAVNEFHDLRIAVRDLLVRCEIALRFYEVGKFLEGKPLYTDYELGYPTRGNWMKQSYIRIVWLVCVGFILLLWREEITQVVRWARS